jgi:chitinase
MSSTDPRTMPDPPGPELSPLRVFIAVLVLIAAGTGAFFALQDAAGDRTARAAAASREAPFFAPYVDATLTPTVAFQERASNPARDVVLGFVVAGTQADQACTPTWGTYATLPDAATTYDLDRRIAQVRGQGGDAVISFGGQANSELAVACDRPDDLAAAYRSVVDRYSADTVDFDVEGAAVADSAANARRATAIKSVQDGARAKHGHLAVWLTLPVTPQGLNPDALAVVRAMLAAKVDLAGVNIMAMDFGLPSAAKDMRKAVTSAITATRAQLPVVFGRAGVKLSAAHLWAKLGVTVMIGQNDVDAERLSVADARAVGAFAASHGLSRVSAWSLNRDSQCGATFAVLRTHSNFCSGAAQKPLEFSKVLAAQLRGGARSTAAAVTASDALPEAAAGTTVDDPKKSPYPIWQPQQAYPENYKVVWHQAVYVAKWYSQGATPDSPNVTPGNAPWRLIGPVLATDRKPVLKRLPAGTHPSWSATHVYTAGAKVLFHGLPFQASWYTEGERPGDTGQGGGPSPWKPLFTIPGEPKAG